MDRNIPKPTVSGLERSIHRDSPVARATGSYHGDHGAESGTRHSWHLGLRADRSVDLFVEYAGHARNDRRFARNADLRTNGVGGSDNRVGCGPKP
jgi:hypothetical protein